MLPSPSYRPLGRMPLFHPGRTAYFNGREVVVGHVLIRKGQLFVHLNGVAHPVPSEHIDMAPTELQWPSDRMETWARREHTPAMKPSAHPPSQATQDPESSADDIFAQAMSDTAAIAS